MQTIHALMLVFSLITSCISSCFSSSETSQESYKKEAQSYILDRLKKREEVLERFKKIAIIKGDKISIKKFYEILDTVAENKIGCFLLELISDSLKKNLSNNLPLNVRIDQQHPMFDPASNTIKFAISPLSLQVIPEEIFITHNEVKTISQDTPADVALFHELLHWA
jgi:hypothetical protein